MKACQGPVRSTCHISVLQEQLHLHVPSFPSALSQAVTWIGVDLLQRLGRDGGMHGAGAACCGGAGIPLSHAYKGANQLGK